MGALACHLAINSGLGLLPRNTGGNLRLLPIDAAEADIAISPLWSRRECLTIHLGDCNAKRASRRQRSADEKRISELQCALQISTTLFGNSSRLLS
jgi:hypothetical protein